MKADITFASPGRANIVLPSYRSSNTIIYAFPPKDVVIASHKISQEILATEYRYSTKLVLDIPGAAIKMPIVRLRLIGDLPGLTMASASKMNLHDFYYIEE